MIWLNKHPPTPAWLLTRLACSSPCAIVPLGQDCWLEPAVTRAIVVNEIEATMSAVFDKVLDLFFGNDGQDLAVAGLTLPFSDGTTAIPFADVRFSTADEAALHAMYGCKVSSGLKPCLCCINVYNANLA